MNRRQLLIAVPLILTAPAARAADPRTPEEIVKMFYAVSAGKNGKWEGPSAFFDEAIRKRHFSHAFQAALAAEEKASDGEVGAIDFDPISNSQDPSVYNLKIAGKPGTAGSTGSTRVAATFTYGKAADKDKQEVDYDFIQEGGDWKLDNIVVAGDPVYDLRQAIEEYLKEAAANTPSAPAK